MAITNIGTSADGSNIFSVDVDGEDYFYLSGKDDLITDATSGWLGFLNADSGSNKVIVRSEIHSLNLNNGADFLVAKGDAFIASADLGQGKDSVTLSNNAKIKHLDTNNGNDDVSVKGFSQIDALNMGNGHDTLTVSGNGRVDFFRKYDGTSMVTLNDDAQLSSGLFGDGNDTIVLNGNSRAFLLKLGRGDNSLTSEDGNIESIYAYEGSNTLNIGAGGVQQIAITGDGGD